MIFDMDAKTTQWKRTVSLINGTGAIGMKKRKLLDPIPHHTQKLT